ncbi:hypothetical protein MMC30_007871 [Trapelia coarctata]|nr:hypothetical protein [Trapelia coarctata]
MARLSITAGVRDSALTIHGSLQAERLARHLAATGVRPMRIFSSDLQRAYKTAEAILLEQSKLKKDVKHGLDITQLPILREQDFGFYEGKPFSARPRDSNKPGIENRRSEHHSSPGFKDVESKEAVAKRMSSFLEEYIVPHLREGISEREPVFVIVSHGNALSTMWRCLLKRFASQSVRLGTGVEIKNGTGTLEYLGPWSNTGYLLLDICPLTKSTNKATASGGKIASAGRTTSSEKIPSTGKMASARKTTPDTRQANSDVHGGPVMLHDHTMVVKAVNRKDHLQGLKRTGGGVGSSKFDEGQKTIETFFKKKRV